MYARLVNRWDATRDSFWFVPATMSLAAILLAFACTSLEGRIADRVAHLAPWVAVSTEAARVSLATIGSAMVSIAGIVLSVMLVTLSITSSQYGSRLLRSFMSDRTTQFALGILMSTSLFCLMALAGIRETQNGQPANNVSVIIGMLMAICSLAVLIGFIHHISSLIQAPNVVAAVADDLRDSFDRLFPDPMDESSSVAEDDEADFPNSGTGVIVHSVHEGYLQSIDLRTLVQLAHRDDLFFRLSVKAGEFVERDQTLLEVWPQAAVGSDSETRHRDEQLDDSDFLESLSQQVNESFIAGRRRTPRQDAHCALEELVEVAVRALSPGINDPFTAIACIDRLAAALGRVARRAMPGTVQRDDEGVPRVLIRDNTYDQLLDSAFNQIRQYGCNSVAVAIRLLEALRRIASHCSRDEQFSGIQRHAEMLQRDFRVNVEEPEDGDDFRKEWERLSSALQNAKATTSSPESSV